MNSHILIQSKKEDIFYCEKCGRLSYKGKICQNLPFKCINTFNIDPLKIKYHPITAIADYNIPSHIKYLECKNKGISKIKSLTNNFGLKSMILYKAINFMNQIYLENNNVPLDYIDIIASLCVLLVTDYNECCIPTIIEEYLTKDEKDILYGYNCDNNINNNLNNGLIPFKEREGKIKHQSNLEGLFRYIKKNVNNFRYWEIMCLKYLNYDLGKYTAYDYLILFFQLGLFFCEENIDIIDKLKYCVQILDYIILNKSSCDFSQYTFAMSIIKIVLEKDNFFDKNVFKYIYGVDLSKKKYIHCSNLIKNILNFAVKIDSIKSLNYMINFNKINNFSNSNQICFNNYINKSGQNIYINNNNFHFNKKLKNHKTDKKDKKDKNKEKIETNFFIYNNTNNNRNFNGYNKDLINNNNIIINNNSIINNNININNKNITFQNFLNKKYNTNVIGNKIGINNNYYFFNINDNIINNCNSNFP